MSVARNLRHLRRSPCPVCGGYDEALRGKGIRCHGFTSADGEWCRCSNEEFAGNLDQEDGLFRHKMHGECRCGQVHAPAQREEPEAVYDYRDEAGTLLFQVVRKPGKRFLQRRPDPSKPDGWEWKTAGMAMSLYRLPQLLKADTDETIYVVEGEKDADYGAARGLLTTCNPRGAGKWGAVADLARKILAGRDVVIVADKDEPGRKHAADTARSLQGVARSVRTVEAPEAKDLAAHLEAGGSVRELVEMVAPAAAAPAKEEAREYPASDTRLRLVRPDDSKPSPPDEPEAFVSQCTDAANADAVVAEGGGDSFRWVQEWERWIAWDGARWAIESGKSGAQSAVYKAVITMARRRFVEAHEQVKDLEPKLALSMPKSEDALKYEGLLRHFKRLRSHYEKTQNAGTIASCAKLLQGLLPVSIATLDKKPWLFNAQNGTIDLKTGELRAHDRADMLTQVSPVTYDPEARCPTWDNFVHSAMGGSTLLRLYLQRVVGYQMTGSTNEQCLVFHFGGGSNGKSTFRGTVQALFGDYATAAPRGLVIEARGGTPPHPTELARLYGKRFAACAEVGENEAFDESKIKDLTGGDIIACRRMNEDFWDLHPTHKLDLFGNHKPTIRANDDGIWRRMRLIPWLVKVAPENQDRDLPEKLRAELPGILNWAIEGCLEWQRLGLAEPPEVTAAGEAYRSDSDVLGAFLRDHCEFGQETRCARKDLRKRYENWCEELGHKPVGARKLAERLRGMNVCEAGVRRDGRVVDGWAGVQLKVPDVDMYGAN